MNIFILIKILMLTNSLFQSKINVVKLILEFSKHIYFEIILIIKIVRSYNIFVYFIFSQTLCPIFFRIFNDLQNIYLK